MTLYTVQDLERADRHVADAEARIARHRVLSARLEDIGVPTAEADSLLAALLALRDQMAALRDTIAAAIEMDDDSVPFSGRWRRPRR